MTLTLRLVTHPSPIIKDCDHVYDAINSETALITGLTGKRIRVWRFHLYCATASKTCIVYSGTNNFGTFPSAVSHILNATDGVPVFTCNDGENFIAAPNDQTEWVTYVVYSIE